MKRILAIAILILSTSFLGAQMPGIHPYYPHSLVKDSWKYSFRAYYHDDANSNHFNNELFSAINKSEYLTDDLKDRQISSLDGQTLTGRIRQSGVEAWFSSIKKPGKLYFYAGLDFQQVLDSQIDPDLIGLLLKGNKPYAGQTLSVPDSEYLNIYFNRIKGGLGMFFGSSDIKHSFRGVLAFSSGQNYDWVKVTNSSFYTHPEGDYLDAVIIAETKSSDSTWGKVYDINGVGISADLHYAIEKEKDFYAGIGLQNLGFINWNKNPFSASMDTTFRFDGVSNDTTNNQGIPNDYSYDNLKNLIFKNPDDSPFSKTLPVIINVTAGKFFSDGKFYAGMNAFYYPTLISNYRLEVFGTWNHKDQLQVTPIVVYSSYSKFNFGFALGWFITDQLVFRAGSSYLNSYFSKTALVGQGGYLGLTFYW
ncbi:MAG: hypothetical protein KQI35_15170 [Bacteroidetes bacterium]|nr:hypothetical protein [Bacteroidota bacterium]